jgi:hypothetical protein
MKRVADKEVFYEHLLQERSAAWLVATGVSFVSCREHCCWGMALHVEGRVLIPEQLRHALSRRFGEAERYSGYFLFLDARQDFFIWRALPTACSVEMSLEDIRHAQLTLAGFEHLFG